MRVLLVAPQPFYQERGTPIAVHLLAKALCEAGHEVDLLVYREGEDVEIPGLTLHRIPRIPLVRDVPIGFSFRKLVCDVFLFARTLGLLRRRRPHVFHANEEAIFFSLLLPRRRDRRVVYDMDSSMADQLVEKWSWLRPVSGALQGFENLAVRRADWVLPVCRSLADKVRAADGDKPMTTLEDIALEFPPSGEPITDLRALVREGSVLALYVGNLEHYQGVDALVEAMARAQREELELVLIGGQPDHREQVERRAEELGLSGRIHVVGPRPVHDLMAYLRQADVLVSPRLKGVNTPMKIYSYLAAGRAVLATAIDSHTQVLDDDCACLVAPSEAALAGGLDRLAADEVYRRRLGEASAERARLRHSYPVFRDKLTETYRQLEEDLRAAGD